MFHVKHFKIKIIRKRGKEMLRTITKFHVYEVIDKETKEVHGELQLPKNTYSPKAGKKILEEKGYNTDDCALVYKCAVQEKRELSDEDFIKYSKVVE
jgi:hypothetical protein